MGDVPLENKIKPESPTPISFLHDHLMSTDETTKKKTASADYFS